MDEEQTFYVEKILARKMIRGKVSYLIKWEGYSSAENTWEPASNLNPKLIKAFEKKRMGLSILESSDDDNDFEEDGVNELDNQDNSESNPTLDAPPPEKKMKISPSSSKNDISKADLKSNSSSMTVILDNSESNLVIDTDENNEKKAQKMPESEKKKEPIEIKLKSQKIDVTTEIKLESHKKKETSEKKKETSNKKHELEKKKEKTEKKHESEKKHKSEKVKDHLEKKHKSEKHIRDFEKKSYKPKPLLYKQKEEKSHQEKEKKTSSRGYHPKVEEIKGYAEQNGCNYLLVKFANYPNLRLVPNQKMREKYPQELIDFYESKVTWDNDVLV